MSPKTYTPRVPVLFYPPEGFTVVILPETFDSSGTSRCLHCERAFRSRNVEGAPVFTMCCSLRCYQKLRGIRDPSTGRDGANLVRGRKRSVSILTREQTDKDISSADPLG